MKDDYTLPILSNSLILPLGECTLNRVLGISRLRRSIWTRSEPNVAPKVSLGHVVAFKADCQRYTRNTTIAVPLVEE